MVTTTVSDKYQVVIPKLVRTRLGLKIGQKITMQPFVDQGIIVLIPQSKKKAAWYEKLDGLGKEVWAGIDPLEYVRSLRDEW